MIESKPGRDDLFYSPSSSIAITWGQFFVGIALYVLSYYLIDDAFGYWTTDTVTAINILKFVIGMLLLPFGLIFWQCGIFRLSSHTNYHWIANITFLFLFVIALFTVGAIYFVKWGIQDWLQWDANFEGFMLVKFIQALYLVLTMWLTGITIFHILLRAILQRNLYTTEAKIDPNAAALDKSGAERQPLINTEMTAMPQDDPDSGSGGGQYRAMNKAEKELEETTNRFFEYVSVFLFFFVYIPIFLWINCVAMSDWHRMYPSLIITKLASTTGLIDNWNIYFQFTCGIYSETGEYTEETCYARLYYDLLYWYLFVFWVAIISYIVCKSPALRIAFRKRIYLGIELPFFNLISVTVGEIIFWILWIVMMALIGHYFIKIHLYDDAVDPRKETKEVWARYIGIMGIQFMTMFLFCTTRIRLWNDCFMISMEHLVAYHRFFGVLFILAGYIHLVLWISFLNDSGEYENYLPFATVPWTYHADNFTPIVMYYVMIIMVPIVYVMGTFYLIRRKYFELFYYTHLFGGLIMIGAILWHASQAWRYIIPPLSLYTLDRMIRLANSSRICKINKLSISVDGSENDNRIEISKLSFSVGSYNMKHGESIFKNINYKMGQYVFINISNISLYQWHPFTISSGENENDCYLMIQNEGDKVSYGISSNNYESSNLQFTSLLYLLAQKVENNELGTHEIELHVDGPYGKPFVYKGYERVILVAGGIGITPVHSIFSTLLSLSMKYGGKDEEGSILPFVDLIWVAKDSKMFSMFTNTWRSYEEHNPNVNNKFNVRLFATRQGGNVSVVEDSDDIKSNNDNNRGTTSGGNRDREDTEFNHVVPHTDATMYTYGRPDWNMVLNTLINDGNNNPNRTMVFACGPEPLLVDVEKQAVKNGARFHSEGFLF